jgi:hypothetical protein
MGKRTRVHADVGHGVIPGWRSMRDHPIIDLVDPLIAEAPGESVKLAFEFCGNGLIVDAALESLERLRDIRRQVVPHRRQPGGDADTRQFHHRRTWTSHDGRAVRGQERTTSVRSEYPDVKAARGDDTRTPTNANLAAEGREPVWT